MKRQSSPGADHERACDSEDGRSRSAARVSGTPLVLGLVVIAACLGLFALWFQWHQTRRCLEFYGSATAALLQRAERVEVWERATAAPTRSGEPSHGDRVSRYDVTQARGLVHLRRGFVEDANLDWSRLDEHFSDDDAWDLALAFFESPDAATPAAVLLCDRADGKGTLGVAGRPGRVGLGRLASGIERWWEATRRVAPLAARREALKP